MINIAGLREADNRVNKYVLICYLYELQCDTMND